MLVPLLVAGFRHSLALVLVGLTGLALTAAGVWGRWPTPQEGWTTNRPRVPDPRSVMDWKRLWRMALTVHRGDGTAVDHR